MTFFLLKSPICQTVSVYGDCRKHVTRTGKGITLLYLSLFEPDTTSKCMNEIFLLLTVPALDEFFWDAVTGELKKEFLFVVDNGPQERPQNCLVQMCMVRILKLPKLDKITQVSFAEYNSKPICCEGSCRRKPCSIQAWPGPVQQFWSSCTI